MRRKMFRLAAARAGVGITTAALRALSFSIDFIWQVGMGRSSEKEETADFADEALIRDIRVIRGSRLSSATRGRGGR
jgi:hypothetical protein